MFKHGLELSRLINIAASVKNAYVDPTDSSAEPRCDLFTSLRREVAQLLKSGREIRQQISSKRSGAYARSADEAVKNAELRAKLEALKSLHLELKQEYDALVQAKQLGKSMLSAQTLDDYEQCVQLVGKNIEALNASTQTMYTEALFETFRPQVTAPVARLPQRADIPMQRFDSPFQDRMLALHQTDAEINQELEVISGAVGVLRQHAINMNAILDKQDILIEDATAAATEHTVTLEVMNRTLKTYNGGSV